MSAKFGRFARAVSSILGFVSGVLASTFVISMGSRVFASPSPMSAGSVYVMVTQALSTTSGNVVSGAVSILGYATPDLDVAGIQFQINGVNVGSEITSGVCGINWDTTAGPDGSYSVSAIVRDTSSNFITA